jgi:ABC-type uncharacterized transport system involved in gliding motility auxiliary subunit
MILYQCMGITGVILMLYGFFAGALLHVFTGFFWTLMGVGAALTIVFIFKALSRPWQKTIGAFVVLNLPWVLLVALPPYGFLASLREASWQRYVVAGVALLGNAAAVYLGRIFLREHFRSRSLQYGTSAAVYTAIAFAILIVFNIFATDLHHQWDVTEEQVNKLSDQTSNILKELRGPLHMYLFMDDRSEQKPAAKNILQMYATASRKVELHLLDADKDRALATEFGAKDGDVAVRYEGRKNVTQVISEEGITQAIMKVYRTTSPTVCFTTGHGELDLDGPDSQERSASALKGGLTNEGYVPRALQAGAAEIPADCQMLTIAGPVQAFTPDEAKAVDQFLAKGGKALVMLDPNVPDPRRSPGGLAILPTGLESVLSKWGVEVGKNFILQKFIQLMEGERIGPLVAASSYGEHPIVTPLKGRQTVFQTVRSIRKKSDAPATAAELVSSAPGAGNSWAEGDIQNLLLKGQATPGGPGDLAGPVPLAVAVEKTGAASGEEKAPVTRLVVYGDSDFVSNAVIGSYQFNFDLALNSLNWMQGEVEQISIRPKKLRASAIELTQEQSNTLVYFAVIGIPMIVLIFGLDLWWWRRRRG